MHPLLFAVYNGHIGSICRPPLSSSSVSIFGILQNSVPLLDRPRCSLFCCLYVRPRSYRLIGQTHSYTSSANLSSGSSPIYTTVLWLRRGVPNLDKLDVSQRYEAQLLLLCGLLTKYTCVTLVTTPSVSFRASDIDAPICILLELKLERPLEWRDVDCNHGALHSADLAGFRDSTGGKQARDGMVITSRRPSKQQIYGLRYAAPVYWDVWQAIHLTHRGVGGYTEG